MRIKKGKESVRKRKEWGYIYKKETRHS